MRGMHYTRICKKLLQPASAGSKDRQVGGKSTKNRSVACAEFSRYLAFKLLATFNALYPVDDKVEYLRENVRNLNILVSIDGTKIVEIFASASATLRETGNFFIRRDKLLSVPFMPWFPACSLVALC